jgi:hypothetical protein
MKPTPTSRKAGQALPGGDNALMNDTANSVNCGFRMKFVTSSSES